MGVTTKFTLVRAHKIDVKCWGSSVHNIEAGVSYPVTAKSKNVGLAMAGLCLTGSYAYDIATVKNNHFVFYSSCLYDVHIFYILGPVGGVKGQTGLE